MGFAFLLKEQTGSGILFFHFIPDREDEAVKIIIVIGNTGTVCTVATFESSNAENPENDIVPDFPFPVVES